LTFFHLKIPLPSLCQWGAGEISLSFVIVGNHDFFHFTIQGTDPYEGSPDGIRLICPAGHYSVLGPFRLPEEHRKKGRGCQENDRTIRTEAFRQR